MGRQQIILTLLTLAACDDPYVRNGSFDGPAAAAVLDSREMGPFEEPVGFVANSRDGLIIPVDLKHATLLSDQVAAPFLRPRWVATGSERILGQLAVWAPTDESITLYAADIANNVLVEAPYITGMDPNPVLTETTHSGILFEDRDESGESARLTGVTLTNGRTTTESWIIEYDGTDWSVSGTASGLQPERAQTGEYFRTENHELAFTIKGKATRGDLILLDTDNGITEHDLGGTIIAMERVPGEALLVAAVWNPLLNESSVVLWDLELSAERGRFTLPEGSQAWRFAFGQTIADLFIADAHQPFVYRALLQFDDPSTSEWSLIPTAAPVAFLTWISDSLEPGEQALDEMDTGDLFDDPSIDRDYEKLFVAPVGLNRVDVYDLQTNEWVDVNPLDVEDGGLPLGSPVTGLDATINRVTLKERNDQGTRLQEKVVAVTTFSGSLILLEGDTGCAAQTLEGPHVPIVQGVESIQFSDVGNYSSPEILEDDATLRRVMTSSCGGVAQTERWTVTYDEIEGKYAVEGTLSGLQENYAIEDQRYVSDDGSVSFTIIAGNAPTTDGDTFIFNTDEGILRMDSLVRPGSQYTEALELPAEPVIFQYRAGPTGGGWDPLDERTFVMVPITNSDMVMRVRVKPWDVEAVWD